ncbi:MAG: ribonuclease III [Saprospiraceae bacterium]|nr:ribonuclease III [Saprospiraceae bacterium]
MVNIIIRLYNYHFSVDKDLARKLRPVIGFIPVRIQLFKRAFYHKSMNNDGKNGTSNERLEYLGDAVLSTIVAEYLFKKYPNRDEGFLTKMRSKIVKRKTLNDIADQMGLDLILSNYSQGRMSHSMLGNALEALVGAVYIEFGYKKTKRYVVKNILMKFLDIHALETQDDNYKSLLLEWCQKQSKDISYQTLSKFKMDKRDRFKVAVLIDGQQMATAEDFNKKSAEQTASKKAIKVLNIKKANAV